MNKFTLPVIIVAIVGVVGIAYALMRNDDTKSNESNSETVTSSTNTSEEKPMQNIVEIAQSNPQFSTLVTAIVKTDLVDTLSSEGPFTVFAPTNDAFAALGTETLNAVLADKQKLTSILTYHVVPEKLVAADVLAKTSLTTVQGGELMVKTSPAMINDANITSTDIMASNGVIHVIDKVLLPK